MRHFHVLETEKYYHEANQHLIRQLRNRRAKQDLMTFLLGLAAMGVGVYAAREWQNWLPVVIEFVESFSRRWL